MREQVVSAARALSAELGEPEAQAPNQQAKAASA
jgi:hypothetical protein